MTGESDATVCFGSIRCLVAKAVFSVDTMKTNSVN